MPRNHSAHRVSVIQLAPGAVLRELGVDDVTDAYVDGLNDPVVHRYLVSPRCETQTRELVETFVRQNAEDEQAILFGLFLSDTLVGTCRLHDIVDGRAFIGICIFSRDLWNTGWGTRVTRAITHYALVERGVQTLAATTAPDNVAAQRLLANVGFSRVPARDLIDEMGLRRWWEIHRKG